MKRRTFSSDTLLLCTGMCFPIFHVDYDHKGFLVHARLTQCL